MSDERKINGESYEAWRAEQENSSGNDFLDAVKIGAKKLGEAGKRGAEAARERAAEIERERVKRPERELPPVREAKNSSAIKRSLIFMLLGAALLAVAIMGASFQATKNELSELKTAYDEAVAAQDTHVIEVTPEITVTDSTVREIITPAAELVTYKYFYTDIGQFEKSRSFFGITIPFASDTTVFSYSGVIGAGVDLNSMDITVDNDLKRVTVRLPQPQRLYHQFDDQSFKYFDVQTSLFTSTALGEYTDFIAALKTEQENKLAVNNEFWSNVRQNAKSVVMSLLTASGELEEYTIAVEWKS